MSAVRLHETKHPDNDAQLRFDSLIGIDGQKEDLLDHLSFLLNRQRLDSWVERHHSKGLPIVDRLRHRSPLIMLAGDVGCGKTALATTVGTPLAKDLEAHVVAFETPSDIRGNGLVGDLSGRVTSAFEQAHAAVTGRKRGLLVIDEGDDLGATRSQLQAHHEDRAGLNVLIKQIDRLAREAVPLAVLLVTNRLCALDPALLRRAHVIRFARPDSDTRRMVLARLLEGTGVSEEELNRVVEATERAIPFSYSDLVHRLAEPALRLAIRQNVPFTAGHILAIAKVLEPTPLIEGVFAEAPLATRQPPAGEEVPDSHR